MKKAIATIFAAVAFVAVVGTASPAEAGTNWPCPGCRTATK